MKFSVIGADKQSGKDVKFMLEAKDQAAAEQDAAARGVMVGSVTAVREPESDAIALVDEPAPVAVEGAAASGLSSHGTITLSANSPQETAHSADGHAKAAEQPAAMEYHIVMNQALYLLEVAVNKYIKDGWEPQGGLTIGSSNNALQYFQALVRKRK